MYGTYGCVWTHTHVTELLNNVWHVRSRAAFFRADFYGNVFVIHRSMDPFMCLLRLMHSQSGIMMGKTFSDPILVNDGSGSLLTKSKATE